MLNTEGCLGLLAVSCAISRSSHRRSRRRDSALAALPVVVVTLAWDIGHLADRAHARLRAICDPGHPTAYGHTTTPSQKNVVYIFSFWSGGSCKSNKA